jgi:hypothetical protein
MGEIAQDYQCIAASFFALKFVTPLRADSGVAISLDLYQLHTVVLDLCCSAVYEQLDAIDET